MDESEENRKTLQKERMLFDIALFTDSKRKMREKAGAGARIIPMLRSVSYTHLSIFTSLQPIWVFLIMIFFYKEKATWKKILGISIGLVGACLLYTSHTNLFF